MNRRELYQKAKKGNEEVVVVEGVHAFKHAFRFGAEFVDVVTDDKEFVIKMMQKVATKSDVEGVKKYVEEIDKKFFNELTTDSLRTHLTAIAKKPKEGKEENKITVFLENPKDIDNVGAVMRVAAAADVGTVCVSGEVNPWHLHAIRAGAGLQFALNIKRIENLSEIVVQNQKVYSCDADGKNMKNVSIEKKSILIFGTERDGVSEAVKKNSDEIISIPMRDGVSSLNLATSVSAILYGANFS